MTQNHDDDAPHCLVDDASVFVGYASFPIARETEFKRKFAVLFQDHQDKVAASFSSETARTAFKKSFYVPAFYAVFSCFDLAVISLIDDFEFPTQTFHPYHPFWPEIQASRTAGADRTTANRGTESFYHQVITGPFPRFDASHNGPEGAESGAAKLANATFLAQHPMPLMGVCQFKLNNELLIGTGTDFLRCVVKTVQHRFTSRASRAPSFWAGRELQMLMFESTAWSELTLVLFSNAYNSIVRFVLDLRSVRISDLEASCRACGASGDWDKLFSLLSRRAGNHGDISVLVNSITTLGFRFELFENSPTYEGVSPIAENDSIHVFCRFSTWPERLGDGISAVVGAPLDVCAEKILICTGRGDFVFPADGTKHEMIKTREYIRRVVEARLGPEVRRSVTATNSILSVAPESVLSNIESLSSLVPSSSVEKPPLEQRLIPLEVGVDRVAAEIYSPMKRLSLPKVVTLRAINAVALYNEGIQDYFLFPNFLELRPFVEVMLAAIGKLHERADSHTGASVYLNTLIDTFETGWRNRFHAAWRLGEITDFNLEFKGGIQQLVTAIDGAYKAVSAVLGRPEVIAVVGGSPRLHSTEAAVHLNYFDIFKPEFFAARASHEAAGHRLVAYNPDEFEEVSKLISPGFGASDAVQDEVTQLRSKLRGLSDWLENDTTPFTDKLFRSVFADICAAQFTYMGDPELFTFWYRNVFIADPEAWNISEGPPSPVPRHLWDYLVRLFLVLEVISPERSLEVMAKFWSRRDVLYLGLDPDHLSRIQSDIRSIVSSSRPFRSWIKATKDCVATIASRHDFDATRLRTEIAEEMCSRLTLGRVCDYSGDEGNHVATAFAHVQSLFWAYLTELKRRCGDGNVLLERSANGDARFDQKRDAKILFDIRGGTRVPDWPDIRWYFRIRCAFLMSLWDMATKRKLHTDQDLQRILGLGAHRNR
jgi:hypothetical protein